MIDYENILIKIPLVCTVLLLIALLTKMQLQETLVTQHKKIKMVHEYKKIFYFMYSEMNDF